MTTLTLTIRLDVEQFDEPDAAAFFATALAEQRALVKIDGYAFDGLVTAAEAVPA